MIVKKDNKPDWNFWLNVIQTAIIIYQAFFK